jgi:lysophospholipase L1-like esterase
LFKVKGEIDVFNKKTEFQIIAGAVILCVFILIFEFISVKGFPGKSADTGKTNPKSQIGQQEASNKDKDLKVLQNNTPKIVALGDSYTSGYPGKLEDSWPARLGKVLNQTVVNKGKGKQTAQDLVYRFETDVVSEKPDRVIILAGTGDALQGVKLEQYQEDIKALVNNARSNKITPILALPLQYPGFQNQIKAMRDWEQSYAKTEKIVILDFASVLYNANGKFNAGLSGDGVYPSAKGYQVMGDYAAGILK